MNDERHEMVLEKTHPFGAEEWNCPNCGRRLLINWEPKFEKTILEAGDEYAIHSGGKGGLKIGPLKINQEIEVGPPSATGPSVEDPYLAPWVRWLDIMDWDDLWNEDPE